MEEALIIIKNRRSNNSIDENFISEVDAEKIKSKHSFPEKFLKKIM